MPCQVDRVAGRLGDEVAAPHRVGVGRGRGPLLDDERRRGRRAAASRSGCRARSRRSSRCARAPPRPRRLAGGVVLEHHVGRVHRHDRVEVVGVPGVVVAPDRLLECLAVSACRSSSPPSYPHRGEILRATAEAGDDAVRDRTSTTWRHGGLRRVDLDLARRASGADCVRLQQSHDRARGPAARPRTAIVDVERSMFEVFDEPRSRSSRVFRFDAATSPIVVAGSSRFVGDRSGAATSVDLGPRLQRPRERDRLGVRQFDEPRRRGCERLGSRRARSAGPPARRGATGSGPSSARSSRRRPARAMLEAVESSARGRGSRRRGRAGSRGSASPARPTPRRRSTGGSRCRRRRRRSARAAPRASAARAWCACWRC